MKSPVALGAIRKLFKELADVERKPVAIGGPHELARALERTLARNGDASAVRVGSPQGAAVYVVIGDDADALREARRARVPAVVVEDISAETVAAAIASRLGDDAAPLAARLPVLREAVCERIVASFARKNGIVGAAVFVPGVDMPVLTLNQIRMLLLLDQAYGRELDPRERLPEILATVGAGFGFRAAARELLDFAPGPGWAVKGGVAYAGTRALGEAALLRLRSADGTA